MSQAEQTTNRRPVGMRDSGLIQRLARRCARAGITPNAVSLTSVVFSAAAGAALIATRFVEVPLAVALLLLVPVLVALRGLCNLIDGLIAVEGGRRTASGEVFNDVPDRVSDLLLFVGAGYGAVETWGIPLGWAAGAGAVLVAYTRMLGGALGTPQFFDGPADKTGRMALLCIASVGAAIEVALRGSTWSLTIGLAVLVVGSLLTAARRVIKIVRTLEAA